LLGPLFINGVFISKKGEPEPVVSPEAETRRSPAPAGPEYLPPPDTNELFLAGFSVTEETTQAS
jgi:hypothetical protein